MHSPLEQIKSFKQLDFPKIAITDFLAKHHTPSMAFVLKMLPKLPVGSIDVGFKSGQVYHHQGQFAGPQVDIQILDEGVARQLLTGGALGFCEAYLTGAWQTSNMKELFIWALRNEDYVQNWLNGKGWYRFLQWLGHFVKPNSRNGSRKNIAYHYDLGNGFYQHWLDETMTYSAAKFAGANEPLEWAQRRKYADLAKLLQLKQGQHVLEIGCGWGGFAEYAAKEMGTKVTGITISKEQHDFAAARMQAQGLNDLVDIKLIDYRDVTGQFDAIASIEMVEAVGEKYWPTYFNTLNARLHDGGRAGLQVITIADKFFDTYRRGADYIQKYIFPGGMLPTHNLVQQHFSKAGLTYEEGVAFGADYAKTLDIWAQRFEANWPKIAAQGFDPRFKRMWEVYLAYCSAGFTAGTIDVWQVVARKGA